jgi:hypothetical protein
VVSLSEPSAGICRLRSSHNRKLTEVYSVRFGKKNVTLKTESVCLFTKLLVSQAISQKEKEKYFYGITEKKLGFKSLNITFQDKKKQHKCVCTQLSISLCFLMESTVL